MNKSEIFSSGDTSENAPLARTYSKMLTRAKTSDVAPEVHARTELLIADHGYRAVLVIIPASRQLDVKALSRILGGAHLRFASSAELARQFPRHIRGVASPFGSSRQSLAVLDSSLAHQPELVFEEFDHGEALVLNTDEYLRRERPLVATVCHRPIPR
ncbi:MAG: YbaK/EbsC family protein [Pirellulales bacterium]|nr:YbaK/EbsC family protein [Pirellulales bacterium]